MKKLYFLLSLTFLFYSCSSHSGLTYDYAGSNYDVSYVKANLEFLASDQLEGREAASDAEKVASQFIASELKKYGLQPYGDNDSYFQNINFTGRKLDNNSMVVVSNPDGTTFDLLLGDDLMTQAYRKFDKEKVAKKAPLVFAGFGISASEYDYDDYSYIDAKNKIVIVLSGEPYSENENFFNGDKPSPYSSMTSKIKTAVEKGALGVLIVPSEEVLGYWGMMKNMVFNESFQSQAESKEPPAIPAGMISEAGLQKIFDGERLTFEQIKEAVKSNDIPEAFEMTKQASINLFVSEYEKPGRNVVALLPGNNASLSNEFITIGAHYDHVGIMEDEIYNGADDNGSGTVTVLEAARLLTEAKTNERPVLFIFYTAEEKGLLGSEYFINNFDTTKNILVNLNVDMTGRESIDSIHCIGSDRASKEFFNLVEKVNSETVHYFLDYSLSNTRLFRQSDHYSFAEKGYPVVFFFDNMRADLHRPSDDTDKINYNKICKTAHLVSNIALEVSNLDHPLSRD